MYDTWDSYYYPPSSVAILRNIPQIMDAEELAVLVRGAVMLRQQQLLTTPELLEHNFDAEHVRAIHHYLYQDVFDWAGHYRTHDLAKPATFRSFASVENGEIDRYLEDMHRLVNTYTWQTLDVEEFSRAAADVFAYLNQAHPFLDGNGHTSKIFMHQVALRSPFQLDYARVSVPAWNQASQLSLPDLGSYEPVPDSLVPVFRHIVIPRTRSETTLPQP